MTNPSDELPAVSQPTPTPRMQASVAMLENLLAPEVFASLATIFSINGGCVTIKFVSLRWDNSNEPAVQRAVVVARITLPLEGAQSLAGGLQSFLTKHGLTQAPIQRPKTRATDVLAESSI